MFIDVLCNFISLMYFYQLHSVSCKLNERTYIHCMQSRILGFGIGLSE